MPGVEKGSLKGGQQLLSGRSGRPSSLGQLRLERRVGIPLSAEVEKGPQEEGWHVQRPRDVREWGTEQPRGTGTASEEEMAQTWLQRGQGHSQSALYARLGSLGCTQRTARSF